MSLPRAVQLALCETYGLEPQPAVCGFVEIADDVRRETLLVCEIEGEIELRLVLPRDAAEAPTSLDLLCQLVEGVSHFVFVAERARRELPTSQLELELQAEIDKFWMLLQRDGESTERAAARASELHDLLFARASFVHEEGSSRGERYRTASHLAGRVVRRIERELRRGVALSALRPLLRRFYAASLSEKVAFALAA